ncbi:hypothetical protein E1B28_005924 [Marasmius oreades]|uniref:F-box domain-containing protein n=1 Tax=Marasmius oreades TaxID=181124 RepID=A0A9P7S496_9AGAR|nr:uncharacterized protein E1B28_005924 [Marasmius oreades]KAG7095144.1 hypothetical protein E1B28_005924 [Marasmius oreades]
MSTLLQDVLRSSADSIAIEKKLNSISLQHTKSANGHTNTSDGDSDDSDEWVNVVSVPGTPARTRPSSPTKSGGGAHLRPLKGPLRLSSSSSRDILKAFPTEVSQEIFSKLPIRDLAKCALVSKKWNRSQTINYVWFQHYRKENFHDDSLPPGKWTKRESKQNWRIMHLKTSRERSPSYTSSLTSYSRGSRSGYVSPSYNSGYQTPREIREERWRQEAEVAASPGKLEMRAMYKELGGRKARSKTKLGSTGVRDKGGWAEDGDGW